MTAARRIGLHEPLFGGNEWAYVKECLDTGWVSTAGAFVERFEAALAARSGVRYAVAVVNGTAALDLALKLAGVGPDDDVIVPSLTFIATANAVRYQGATPVFLDVEEATFSLDPVVLERFLSEEVVVRGGRATRRASGKRLAACMPMHALGRPARIDAILEACSRRGIPVIEDAAEALGSTYRGRPLGSFGLMSALSFNGNKIITTGGGGALVTDDPGLAARARHLSTQAKSDPEAFWHDAVGFNYRLPNVNAAIGCAQLEQLDRFLARKREIAEGYRRRFDGSPLRVFWEPEGAVSNFWLNALIAPSEDAAQAILRSFKDLGFGSRPIWAPVHRQPMYADCPRGDLRVTDRLWRTVVKLPSSASLGDDDVAAVAEAALAACAGRAARRQMID